MAISADGTQLFALLSGRITQWHLGKNAVVRTIEVGEVEYLSWGAHHPILKGRNVTKSPTLWDPVTGKLLAMLGGHTGIVTGVAWAANGKTVVTGSQDKTADVWDVANGKLLRTLGEHGGAVTTVAVAADGKIATGCADKKVRVWPAKGDKPTRTLSESRIAGTAVTAVAWSRDNRTLASGGNDRDVVIWNADSGKIIKSLDNPTEVQSLAFSPDGRRIAVGSVDDRLRIYQVVTGKLLAELEKPGSPPNVSAVAWSHDGFFVLAGRGNHTFQFWNTRTKRDVLNIGTMAPVTEVAFSSDGRTLVTASLDRAIRFWNAATGRLKTTIIAGKDQLLGHRRRRQLSQSPSRRKRNDRRRANEQGTGNIDAEGIRHEV